MGGNNLPDPDEEFFTRYLSPLFRGASYPS